MQKIAKFEKVSFDRFQKDWLKAFPETEDVQAVYDSIVLPQRATAGSAGYDFYVPAAVTLPEGRLCAGAHRHSRPDGGGLGAGDLSPLRAGL